MTPPEVISRYYNRLWNEWDFSLIPQLLSPDFVFRGSLGITVEGRDGFRGYMETVRGAFPDFHNTIEEIVVDQLHVAARLTYRGTHHGMLASIPPTGRVVSYTGAAFLTVRDNLIAEGWVLGDLYSLQQQLGSQLDLS